MSLVDTQVLEKLKEAYLDRKLFVFQFHIFLSGQPVPHHARRRGELPNLRFLGVTMTCVPCWAEVILKATEKTHGSKVYAAA